MDPGDLPLCEQEKGQGGTCRWTPMRGCPPGQRPKGEPPYLPPWTSLTAVLRASTQLTGLTRPARQDCLRSVWWVRAACPLTPGPRGSGRAWPSKSPCSHHGVPHLPCLSALLHPPAHMCLRPPFESPPAAQSLPRGSSGDNMTGSHRLCRTQRATVWAPVGQPGSGVL